MEKDTLDSKPHYQKQIVSIFREHQSMVRAISQFLLYDCVVVLLYHFVHGYKGKKCDKQYPG